MMRLAGAISNLLGGLVTAERSAMIRHCFYMSMSPSLVPLQAGAPVVPLPPHAILANRTTDATLHRALFRLLQGCVAWSSAVRRWDEDVARPVLLAPSAGHGARTPRLPIFQNAIAPGNLAVATRWGYSANAGVACFDLLQCLVEAGHALPLLVLNDLPGTLFDPVATARAIGPRTPLSNVAILPRDAIWQVRALFKLLLFAFSGLTAIVRCRVHIAMA